jgi:hypothetical protein
MAYDMSWLGTLAAVTVGILLGVISRLFIFSRRPVLIWSALVSIVFVISAMAAVVADNSWLFSQAERAALQEFALAAAIAGLTFSTRPIG